MISYLRSYIKTEELPEGYRIIYGRFHGFNWKKIYTVSVEFESAEEADNFIKLLENMRKE